MKKAIVLLSDPNSGSEEALGRAFNALAAAYDYKQAGDAVKLVFQGTGVRWPGKLADPEHPAHGLFQEVKDTVEGISCGCAAVFGDEEEIEKTGFDLIKDNAVPGTGGLASLRSLESDGYDVLLF